MSEKFSPQIITLAKQLYPYLKDHCRGKENAITHNSLIMELRRDYWAYRYEFTRRQMRKSFKAMLRVLGFPVISGNSGVFVATEQSEIDMFAATERSRASESFANATAAEKCSPARKVDTSLFDFARE